MQDYAWVSSLSGRNKDICWNLKSDTPQKLLSFMYIYKIFFFFSKNPNPNNYSEPNETGTTKKLSSLYCYTASMLV